MVKYYNVDEHSPMQQILNDTLICFSPIYRNKRCEISTFFCIFMASINSIKTCLENIDKVMQNTFNNVLLRKINGCRKSSQM